MTEKNYNPQQKERKAIKKQKAVEKVKKTEVVETPKKEEQKESKKTEETKTSEKKEAVPKIKKTEAIVNGLNLPISTKDAIAICKFINKKKIEVAIKDLEQVYIGKKAVPMKGEIPHRKGKRMMSGRFPKKCSKHFISLLKNLLSNSNANELEYPIISEAVANMASRPYGRFGRTKKKRTHVKIIAKDKIKKEEKKNG